MNDQFGLILSALPHDPVDMAHVGSRVTCNPPPLDTDDDYIVLMRRGDGYTNVLDWLQSHGWRRGGSHHGDETRNTNFASFTKRDLNLLVTFDRGFYEKFLLATYVSVKLNLMDKQDRITLFQAILYGEKA